MYRPFLGGSALCIDFFWEALPPKPSAKGVTPLETHIFVFFVNKIYENT